MNGSGLTNVWMVDCLDKALLNLFWQERHPTKPWHTSLLCNPFRVFSCQVFSTCLARMANGDDPQTISELISFQYQEKDRNLLHDIAESQSDDVNWWQYMDMVTVLLQYTREQREATWDLNFHSFSLMLPYFKRYGHLNYAQWGPVYLLDESASRTILSEFQKGHFVVKRLAHKFSQILIRL